MKEIKPSGLIAVPIPLETISTEILNKESLRTAVLVYTSPISCFPIVIPNGDYEILGWCTNDDISFDLSPFLETGGRFGDEPFYYTANPLRQTTSVHSAFRSLLTANGVLFVNPYKKPKAMDYGGFSEFYKDALVCYKEAESQLVKKVLILKPINQ